MKIKEKIICYHCGEDCIDNQITIQEKVFCCIGCKTVYAILNKNDLSEYYCLNETPGNTVKEVSSTQFQFLEDKDIAAKIISFKNSKQTQVQFYLPQMHCSSCLWLLEHLYQLHEGIISSQVNFTEKKVSISFYHDIISLKKVAELLSSIGYEPHISLQDYEPNTNTKTAKGTYLKLGVVGFCFANIMLISFPEYLGLEYSTNIFLSNFLRFLNLGLAIPVLIIGAKEFYQNAFYGLKQRIINIDTPICLAITITFIRSVYEILSHTGAGYLDSMSGIIFFMLIGRTLQHKTFSSLKFNRDFNAYFPITVNIKENGVVVHRKIQEVKVDDLLLIQHQEIIPVDGILSSKNAEIDYSFVTGENEINTLSAGDLIYAGGKIMNASVEVLAIKPFAQNSFTALWNNEAFNKKSDYVENSFVEKISRYFSLILLSIACITLAYWHYYNPALQWNAMTAVLIVACPCTLLLASSYTFGFIIELFSTKGFFVKNTNTIVLLNQINHIVFDKTGTIANVNNQRVSYYADRCNAADKLHVLSVLKHSTHPLSKLITKQYAQMSLLDVHHIKEVPGKGIEAWHEEQYIKIGSASFVGVEEIKLKNVSCVYFSIDNKKHGYFVVSTAIKLGVDVLIQKLQGYKMSLLSGDNDSTTAQMKALFPPGSALNYYQTPQMKLEYIKALQEKGEKVLMVGDGLNDAGALKQSDVGISIVDDHFSFTPASDVIMSAKQITDLFKFLTVAKKVKTLIIGTFIYSLLYNIIGISIAVSGHMKPVIAAILMPASSISVILIAYLGTSFIFNHYFKKGK